jgi:hypothetical protein
LRRGARPIIGDAMAKFRRDLRLFQSLDVHSRLLGWDRRWIFLEHRFVRNRRVIRVVAIRGVLKGASGKLDPGESSPRRVHLQRRLRCPTGYCLGAKEATR